MKLISFKHDEIVKIGAVVEEAVVDCSHYPRLPKNMIELLAADEEPLGLIQQIIDTGENRLSMREVKLLAPVPRPGKFLGVTLNYADHIAETGRERPEYPTFFTKQSTCVIGDGEAIQRPIVSEKVDYEGELGFVIGKYCRHVPVEKAHEVIAGYTIVNDVSVRDWQIRSATFTLGKSFDTHGPMGPG